MTPHLIDNQLYSNTLSTEDSTIQYLNVKMGL